MQFYLLELQRAVLSDEYAVVCQSCKLMLVGVGDGEDDVEMLVGAPWQWLTLPEYLLSSYHQNSPNKSSAGPEALY